MNIELLSPSGDIDSLKLAVDNGADAVYLGLQNFNARRNANNFNEDNIKDYVRYCHLFNVKVYITLNTNVKDNEIDDLKSTILACKNARVDAFIITDFLTAKLVRELTNIPMHASTQIGVNNLYGAKYLENLGFNRVVLARETKIEDIKEIKAHTNLEIEYFVHGALCVSYSGQCLFSSMISGESANRGLCKQPCRQLYKNLDNNDDFSYLLSTKDLCLIEKLKFLKELGIDSLKIEGRLKRPEYVGVVTNAYRKALDNIDNKNFKFDNLEDELKRIYNRGEFTEGYLYNENVMYNKTQNHIGEYIGKITKIKGNNSIINCKNFDEKNGYKIFRNDKEISGGNFKIIQKIDNENYLINYKGLVGDKFNITTDNDQIEKINILKRKLKIKVFVKLIKNQKFEVAIKYKNICININSDEIVTSALNTPITYKDIEKIFNKIGDYPFEIKLSINMDNDAFIRLSTINNLRKDIYKKLIDSIIEEYESNMYNEINYNTYYNNSNIIDYFTIQKNNYKEYSNKIENTPLYAVETDSEEINIENLSNISYLILNIRNIKNNDNIVKFYYNQILENKLDTKIYLKVPTILNHNDLILFEEYIKNNTQFIQGLYINTVCGFELAKKYNLKIFGGVGLNIYNSLSINNPDLDFVTISTELSQGEIKDLLNKNKLNNAFIYAFGNLPLMTFAHCTNNNGKFNCKNCNENDELTFRDKKFEFNILRNKIISCYFTLYNSFPTNILSFCHNINTNIYLDMLQYSKDINYLLNNIFNNKKLDISSTVGNLNRGVK